MGVQKGWCKMKSNVDFGLALQKLNKVRELLEEAEGKMLQAQKKTRELYNQTHDDVVLRLLLKIEALRESLLNLLDQLYDVLE